MNTESGSSYSSSSFEWNQTDDELIKGISFNKTKNSSNISKPLNILSYSLFAFFLVVMIIGLLSVLGVFLFLSTTKEENYSGTIEVPNGMKRFNFNHVKFDEEKRITDAQASILLINKAEDPTIYNVSPSDDEIYFVSEKDLKLECQVTCKCFYNEESESERRGMNPLFIKIVVAAVVTSFLGLTLIGILFSEECEQACGTKHYLVEDHECEPSEKPENWPKKEN